jgi:hypothetical protein
MSDVVNAAMQVLSHEQRNSVSDGHHTFKELYDTRAAMCAVMWNMWAMMGVYEAFKSRFHADGTPCSDGWFIIGANLPTGKIFYHYPDNFWGLFACAAPERPPYDFDGGNTGTSIERLTALASALGVKIASL